MGPAAVLMAMAPSPATDERLAAVPRVNHAARDVRHPPRRVSAAVLEAFRHREATAVRLVYREYGQLVYAVAHHVLGRHELAEEATQQTFVRAWQAADRVDIDRDPAPWLATIAKRVAIDIHRREARRPAQPSADIVSIVDRGQALMTQAPDGDSLDAVWRVRRAIDALSAEEASVVRLQHLDGMTHVEIAEKLGVPVGTVKSRSHRAHQRLSGLLGNLRRESHD
jgi:RNA polymerase sigma factor (sigma-70 family)